MVQDRVSWQIRLNVVASSPKKQSKRTAPEDVPQP